MIWYGLAITLFFTAQPELRPIRSPAALTAKTSAPEFSGLTWSAVLGRYLVVSDDTGIAAEGSNHAPWVLAMDAEGNLDEAPIPITGISSLNDAEAICAGPGGTFFLVTSHSPNRKGRSHASRRQLLHLELRGRSLAVLGRLDLTAVEGPGTLLEIAGVDSRRNLDIEAVTYRDGALYVGLKSPLTLDGKAVILRLADPVQAMREGRIRRGALVRWASISLCVEAKRGKVCEGVSDLVFLDDGSLVASANSPKGEPKDGGGAVWWLRAPPSGAPAVLLHRFLGLKPEGVAFTPGRRTLAVVFDRGQDAPPLFTEIPLPGDTVPGAGHR